MVTRAQDKRLSRQPAPKPRDDHVKRIVILGEFYALAAGGQIISSDRGRVARTGAWAVSQPPSLDLNTLGGILGIITGALGVPMCSPAVCDRCKKITWTGCGQHVEQALAGVPPENRCTCPVKPASTAGRARARATEKMGARR